MLKRIFHGFLTGIGFSVALVGIVAGAQYIYAKYFLQGQLSAMESDLGWRDFSEDAGLVISDDRLVRSDRSLEVVGTLANNGSDTWDGIEVEVEVFDKDDRFIDECSEYISGNLSPGQTENFKVSCGGCQAHPIPDFARYEISVKDASHVRPTSTENRQPSRREAARGSTLPGDALHAPSRDFL